MRSASPLLLALILLSACPVPDGSLDDDDDAAADDDDTSDEACGLASGGTGGSVGRSWIEVDGFGTPGDGSPDYEVLVYVPADLDATQPAPLALLAGRRMPTNRPENEGIALEATGLGLQALADEQGWIVALPLPGLQAEGLSWSSSATDGDYFRAAIAAVGDLWDVDLDRVWLFGSSAGGQATVLLGVQHADLVAGILNHAGSNPFSGSWPATPWDADCAALFVHDEADPIVSRAAVEDGALMFEAAGQHVERAYDYAAGHAWDLPVMNALMVDFFPRTCND